MYLFEKKGKLDYDQKGDIPFFMKTFDKKLLNLNKFISNIFLFYTKVNYKLFYDSVCNLI